MNKLKLTAAGAVVIFLFSFFKPLPDWVLFENSNCKILFPRVPKNDSTVTETKIGNLTLYTHSLEVPQDMQDSNLVYILIETQYPSKYFLDSSKAFLKGFFDGAVNGAVKQVNGKLLSEEDITQDGYPGKEIKVDYGDGMAIITMRFYLVKTKMFAVETIALTGKEKNLMASRFFGSFKIK